MLFKIVYNSLYWFNLETSLPVQRHEAHEEDVRNGSRVSHKYEAHAQRLVPGGGELKSHTKWNFKEKGKQGFIAYLLSSFKNHYSSSRPQ